MATVELPVREEVGAETMTVPAPAAVDGGDGAAEADPIEMTSTAPTVAMLMDLAEPTIAFLDIQPRSTALDAWSSAW